MKKRAFFLLVSVILVVSFLIGCGSGKKSDSVAGNSVTVSKSTAQGEKAEYEAPAISTELEADTSRPDEVATTDDATAITGGSSVSQSVSNAILAERKIIRKANVTIEVDNFDQAQGKINTFILGIGYIQESNINTEKYYVDSKVRLIKNGIIVIRVDKDKFDKVLNDIKGIGLVTGESIGTDDVTEKFFDIESRLRLLKYEEERLEEYMKELKDPDSIFKTQSRLTDIRHEIEGLTGTLRKLSDLTELSTITVNLYENPPFEDNNKVKPKTYGERLRENFLDSIKGVVSFCGELLILIVQILPVLIILGLFSLAVLAIYRKFSKKRLEGKSKNNNQEM
jgi:hypothetical protein